MKVWFNKINESRRSVVEVTDAEVTIGRDPANAVVPAKPAGLAAARRGAAGRRQAAAGERGPEQLHRGRRGSARRADGRLRAGHEGPHLALHAHLRGREGRRRSPAPSWKPISARSWPSWSCGSTASCSSGSTSTSSRPTAASDPQSILLLENNIEDVCRELGVFGPENEAAAGGDHRPDAPRPPGQPADHGDRHGGVLRPGRR